MKDKNCDFDEARLELVMNQIKEAGMDMESADLTSIAGQSSAQETRDLERKSLYEWNHHMSAASTSTLQENMATWCQLEVTLSAVGVDIEGYTQTSDNARQQQQSKRSFLSKVTKKIGSVRNVAVGKSTVPSVGECHIRILRSEATYETNEDCYASIRTRSATMSMVQMTDSRPTGADVAFQVVPVLGVPPLPAAVSFTFQLWVELGGTQTMVAEAYCGSAELLMSPMYTVMLTSTLSGTADSKLVLGIRKSTRKGNFRTLRTTCWMGQPYQQNTQFGAPCTVREEVAESSLAFELPAKLLKLRAEDLHDELAMLQGKIGEIGALMMDNGPAGSLNTEPAEQDTPQWSTQRINRERKKVIECLEDLTYRAAGAIRNYQLMFKYYTECYRIGQDIGAKREFTAVSCKRSVQRKDSPLRAVTTNLHIHTVFVAPAAPASSGSTASSACAPGDSDAGAGADGANANANSAYSVVTCGAPAAHVFGFAEGGLAAMQHRMAELLATYNQGTDNPSNPSPLDASSCGFIDSLYNTSDMTVGEVLARMQIEVSVARLAFELRLRLDVVLGQALGLVITAFALRIDEIVRNNDEQGLAAMQKLGFVCSIESLLSTAGAEYKMIRDVEGGFQVIQRYFDIVLRERGPSEAHDTAVLERKPNRAGVTVYFLLEHTVWEALPAGAAKAGGAIAIVPVLFTQGVNEMQTISNMLGTLGSSKIQHELNRSSLLALKTHAQQYIEFSGSDDSPAVVDPEHLGQCQSLLDQLDALIRNSVSSKKQHEILWFAGDCIRMLGGGRVTFCKSGKDRTSQSCTLECTRLLGRWHGLAEAHELPLANVMREFGVRRANVRKNTGGFAYSFNTIQVLARVPTCPAQPPSRASVPHVRARRRLCKLLSNAASQCCEPI